MLTTDSNAIKHLVASASNIGSPAIWSTDIHNEIIEQSLPELTNQQKHILRWQSAAIDIDTLFESQANVHAMRRSDQTVEQAREGWQKFINDNNNEARRIQAAYAKSGGKGISQLALQYFGRGNHAVMDETSPTHKGFQLYQQPKFTGNPLRDAVTARDFKRRMDEHTDGEAKISPEQMKEAVEKVRRNFANVFGEHLLSMATGRGGEW